MSPASRARVMQSTFNSNTEHQYASRKAILSNIFERLKKYLEMLTTLVFLAGTFPDSPSDDRVNLFELGRGVRQSCSKLY